MPPLKAAITAVMLFVLSTAASAAGWKGAKILPKSDRLTLQNGSSYSGTIFDIAWPATVEDTSGRWLLVRDEGGFSDRPVSGWVYADDVLKLDEAREFYGELAAERPAAWVYWLRGIYWESQREPGIAFQDYQRAAALDPENRIDDLHIRRGRLAAQSLYRGVTARKFSAADREAYEEQFKKVRNRRPQLYLDWGAALSLTCKCHQRATEPGADKKGPEELPKAETGAGGGGVAKADADKGDKAEFKSLRRDAIDKLAEARKINGRWWRIPLAEAELGLDLCRKESPDKENEPNENLDPDDLYRAQIAFDEAISLNPNSPDAYRDRAELLRLRYRYENLQLLTTDKGAEPRQRSLLQQAKQSANTACTMTLNRQPQSLRVLAAINADLQDYEKAAKYAVKAAEYATDDDREKMKKLSKHYATLTGKTGAELASALHQVWVPAAGRVGETAEPKHEPELYFIDRSLDAYEP